MEPKLDRHVGQHAAARAEPERPRASVSKPNVDDVFEQKNDIAEPVENELEKAMAMYGYEIVQTLIVDIEPDEQVKRATNEINAASRLRVAANEKASSELKVMQSPSS